MTTRTNRSMPPAPVAFRTLVLLCVALPTPHVGAAALGGARTAYRSVTLDVAGPPSSETDTAPDPFLDVRLDVTFTSPSGIAHRVPGFFAGDGLGRGTGNVWRARFSPHEPGLWRWSVDFDAGDGVAVGDAPGRPLEEDGADGTFEVGPPDPHAPGFAGTGRLEHVGEHRLRTADGAWWIGGGVDVPGLLDHAGLDGAAPGARRYAAHAGDWREGDPDFRNEATGTDGRGLVGAIGYLAGRGVNSIRFAPAPADPADGAHRDVSRLFQRGLVLEHMQAKGVAARIVLDGHDGHDGAGRADGDGPDAADRLRLRELVARLGHLNGLVWSIDSGSDGDAPRDAALARRLRALDAAGHPIEVRAPTEAPEARRGPLVGLSELDATSVRAGAGSAGELVRTWRDRSAEAGRKWAITVDGGRPDGAVAGAPDPDATRREVLYPAYFGGADVGIVVDGAGPSPDGDARVEDFRTRESAYRWARVAREFVRTYLPSGRAVPDDAALAGGDPGDRVLSVPGEVHALYLPTGRGARELVTDRRPAGVGDPAAAGVDAAAVRWEIAWFDPRAGRFEGERRVAPGPAIALGEPPSAVDEDWVVLVRRVDAPAGPAATAAAQTSDGDDASGKPAPGEVATANPLAPVPPAVGAAGARTGPAPGDGPAVSTGGGAASWVLLALVLAGRRSRSRTDSIRLVYCRAPTASPGPRPCRPSR